jgi:hypothetical protein
LTLPQAAFAGSHAAFADLHVFGERFVLTIDLRLVMDMKQMTSRYTDWETIAIALVLMITGMVLMGGDWAGILSLDKIQNLWPVALIAVGMIDLLSHPDEPRTAAAAINTDSHARQL